jgi:hypothetical protein
MPRFVAHIQRNTFSAQLSRQRARRLAIKISDHQATNLLLPESPAKASANTTGTTGDDNDFVTKLHDQAA